MTNSWQLLWIHMHSSLKGAATSHHNGPPNHRTERNIGFVETASPNPFFGISRLYPDWFWKFWTAKKTHEMCFLQIRSKPHLEVVWNAIPIWFLHMCLSPDALDTQIWFQSVFCITLDTQRQHKIQSDGSASEWLSRIHAATGRVVWEEKTENNHNLMTDLHFSCFCVGKPRHQRT